jgi:gamma-glutamyltranspeptidase / glutathione hydrolase
MTRHITRRAFVALACALLAACAGTTPAVPSLPPEPRAAAALAMPDAHSADVAATMLESGGNAVDAAVAAAFALAVTYPEAGNVGGGGFMMLQVRGESAFLDYREVAPAAATRDMYLDAAGEVIEGASLTGHRAAGVPGTVAGLWAAHRRYGALPWSVVVAPAIALAEHGYAVPEVLAARAEEERGRLQSTSFGAHFGRLRAGELLRQPELAATLRRIQDAGADDFYRGTTAALIAAEMARGGGLVTEADLAAYRPQWREPLRSTWRGKTVLTAPPPSSGGIALLQLLGMRQALSDDFRGLGRDAPQALHLFAEMAKRVYADRAEYLGDPGFVDVPVGPLVDPAYVARRAGEVRREAVSTLESVRPGLSEPRQTTHYSIVDAQGNAVSNTYTLNTNFGSGVVVGGAGFLLNNQMDDFSAKPGVANFYGVVGADANAIEPGKRMLSSMSPTVVLDHDGAVEAVVGSPGGSTIITTVFHVLTNVYDHQMPAADAVAAPRFHHQLLPPDRITYDGELPAATLNELRRRGYDVVPHGWPLGDAQLLVRRGPDWEAAADPRGRGVARVLPPR